MSIYKLLILADDFTGALDTGIQLAKQGISTIVTTEAGDIKALPCEDAEVLSLDIESRHSSKESAYHTVYDLVKMAKESNVGHIYKKTDSNLRGNIGAELQAVLDASGASVLHFIPAFPKNNRITVGGRHYVNGVAAGKLEFGGDPFDPVRHSYIPDIIHEQSNVSVQLSTEDPGTGERTILVHDASNEHELENIAHILKRGGAKLVAGCAGFAEYLPQLIPFKKTGQRGIFTPGKTALVISGSLNDITLLQINHAKAQGYAVSTLSPKQKVQPDYWIKLRDEAFIDSVCHDIEHTGIAVITSVSEEDDVINTNKLAKQYGLDKDGMRRRAQENIAEMVSIILSKVAVDTLVVFGGDTLIGIAKKMGMSRFIPIAEITPSVVLSEPIGFKRIRIVTKSGGFGGENIIQEIVSRIVTP